MISKDEFIKCNSYVELCDYKYDSSNYQETPPPGIIHVCLDDIKRFFELHDNNGNNYILVSSSSDFGLHNQNEAFYWNDYATHVRLQNPSNIQTIGLQNIDNPATAGGYIPLQMPPPVQTDSCDIRHRYSIRTDRWTWATFHEVPSNVKYWFMTNLAVPNDIMESIPFGIFSDPEVTSTIEKVRSLNIEPENLLYVNFSDYTLERGEIKKYCRALDIEGISLYDKPTLTLEEHLLNVARHKFTICPEGNGIDSYRVLETIYLNGIPILKNNLNNKVYNDMRVFLLDDFRLTGSLINNFLDKDYFNKYNFEKATLSYWKDRFQDAKRLL
jgi:hypothetical protein